MSSEREALTEVLDDVLARAHFGEDLVPLAVTESQADAVIRYLYERAESPEVVEAVRDKIKSIAHDPHITDRYQMYTESVLEHMLETLLGPRPTEQEAADER